MKRVLVLVTVSLLLVGLLFHQCGKKQYPITLLKKAPEIDGAAVADYLAVDEVKIGPTRMFLFVFGTAKKDLPPGTPVAIDRFQGDSKIDTVFGSVSLSREPRLPEGYVIRPGQGGPPPYDFNIYAGDPIRIDVDATMEEGLFTRLVIRLDDAALMLQQSR